MFVSYSRLTGGLPFEALRTLTGQPVMAHLLLYFRDKYTSKSTYELIKDAKQKDYIITAGLFKDQDGLKHVNVYTIIDVFKMKDEKNKVFDT